jgi:hypothetical protein
MLAAKGEVTGSTMAKTTKTAVKPRTDRRRETKSATSDVQTTLTLITDAEIARRAFEVYCARGGQHGRDLDDWLQAERELRSQLTAATH